MEYGEYGEYGDYPDYPDTFGWDGELVGVPGFGFLPPRMEEVLEAEAQDFLREDLENMTNVGPHNISLAEYDMYKCTMITVAWKHFFPFLQHSAPQGVCEPLWDGASCVPATLAGATATFPCMKVYDNKYYDTRGNATRACLAGGSGAAWTNLTDYSGCSELCDPSTGYRVASYPANMSRFLPCEEVEVEGEGGPVTTEISIHIYFIGYSVSLLALLLALCIFLSFREMRCLRHKIHIGLFLTFLLADLSWIFTALVQNMINTEHWEVVVDVWCASHLLLRYFHLTTFFWMFLEGLYLFLQVQLPLSLASVSHIHFLLIGWGCPLVTMGVWLVLRLTGEVHHQEEEEAVMAAVLSCPFFGESETDNYAYQLPIFILLVINTCFLVWIMLIVVSKLRARTAMDHDRRHYKAAKALVVVIPLLGFTYMLTITGPREGTLAYTVFQAVRAALLSTQGFVISLPYCFLNTEVQGVIRTHWHRWKLTRNVGYECRTPRTSIYYTHAGGSGTKVSLMTTRVEGGLLTVPTDREIHGSKTSSRSVSFSDILQPLSPESKELETKPRNQGGVERVHLPGCGADPQYPEEPPPAYETSVEEDNL